jgi:hypothetical protein
MKKLFEISSEEKQRILEMHESATKKNYLMEADPINPPVAPTTNTPPPAPATTTEYAYQNEVLPELKNNIFKFKKGASSIDPNSITNWQEFEKFRDTIINYVNKGKKLAHLGATGSESQTPGKMDNYQLAMLRAKNMLDYLETYFETKGKNVRIEDRSSSGKIGKAKYDPKVNKPDEEQYTNDQWVQVWVKLQK